MGVTGVMILLVVFATVVVELRITRKGFMRKAAQSHDLVGLLISLSIAVLFGFIFGLSGLIIGVGGLIASAITGGVYFSRRAMAANAKVRASVEEAKAAYMPIFRTIKIFFLILTLPLWLPIKINRWMAEQPEPTTAPS